jgi:hypothetical protein
MVLQDTQIFVKLTTLGPSNFKSNALDWRGDRGFFDECVSIARRRGLEDGYFQWTGAPVEQEDNIKNSYYGDDHSLWDGYPAQKERKRELTLAQIREASFSEEDDLGLIVQVI